MAFDGSIPSRRLRTPVQNSASALENAALGDRGIEEWKAGESGEEIGMGRGGRKKSEEAGAAVLGVLKLGPEGGASWDGRSPPLPGGLETTQCGLSGAAASQTAGPTSIPVFLQNPTPTITLVPNAYDRVAHPERDPLTRAFCNLMQQVPMR